MNNNTAVCLKLTIVGGQPSKSRKAANLDTVPGGIGQVLRLAACDAVFCRDLVENRESSLATCGLALTPSEHAALCSVSAHSLRAMIAAIPSLTQK